MRTSSLFPAFIAFLFLSLRATVLAGAPESSPGIEGMAWMAGAWRGESAGNRLEEHWTEPGGKSMLGMGRVIGEGRTLSFEFMRIEQGPEGLVFVAQPQGGKPVSFKRVRGGPREVVFENPQHDFPTRVLYRLEPDGSLFARIEGPDDKGQDFRMTRPK